METGIIGMLEAADYDAIDMVSPFLGAIADVCCGHSDAGRVTSFLQYTSTW